MELRFDHGMLLLENPPAGLDVGGLPATLWDSRTCAFCAPAAAYGELRTALRDAGVSFTDRVVSSRRRPASWKAPDLEPHLQAALDAWRGAGSRGTIVLPSDKEHARVAIAALAHEQSPSLCLVPTRLLLEQWCRTLQEFYQDRVGCYGNGVKRLRSVTVSTYASAELYMDRFGDRFDLLVAEGAQCLADGAYSDAFTKSSATRRMGLTIAPIESGAIARVSGLIGPEVWR